MRVRSASPRRVRESIIRLAHSTRGQALTGLLLKCSAMLTFNLCGRPLKRHLRGLALGEPRNPPRDPIAVIVEFVAKLGAQRWLFIPDHEHVESDGDSARVQQQRE
jgi:hypothetical protein